MTKIFNKTKGNREARKNLAKELRAVANKMVTPAILGSYFVTSAPMTVAGISAVLWVVLQSLAYWFEAN